MSRFFGVYARGDNEVLIVIGILMIGKLSKLSGVKYKSLLKIGNDEIKDTSSEKALKIRKNVGSTSD